MTKIYRQCFKLFDVVVICFNQFENDFVDLRSTKPSSGLYSVIFLDFQI